MAPRTSVAKTRSAFASASSAARPIFTISTKLPIDFGD